MSKCGKGCMPECEYFTTGGCISPFNCQYKIETGYINSATSIPTYMEKQMSMTAEEIEHCLERFTMGKATDVMNFDYAGTLAYIQRLKAENAALRERLERAVLGKCIYYINSVWNDATMTRKDEICQGIIDYACDNFVEVAGLVLEWDEIYFTREAALARLAELKGGKE